MYIPKITLKNYKNHLFDINENNKSKTNFNTIPNVPNAISFQSSKRSLVNDNGIKINGNYTSMFRNDVDWEKLMNLIADANIRHIYSLASSDGSEAYSIAIKLMERLGDDSKKFKPIYASDADEYIVNLANSGYISLKDSDIKKINEATKNKFSKYFSSTGGIVDENGFRRYKVNQILKDFVVFVKSDVVEFMKRMLPPDSILLLRNFWFYLPVSKQKELTEYLYKNTSDNTFIILGSVDLERTDANDYLQNVGFKTLREKIILSDPPPVRNKFVGAKHRCNKVRNGVYKKVMRALHI